MPPARAYIMVVSVNELSSASTKPRTASSREKMGLSTCLLGNSGILVGTCEGSSGERSLGEEASPSETSPERRLPLAGGVPGWEAHVTVPQGKDPQGEAPGRGGSLTADGDQTQEILTGDAKNPNSPNRQSALWN